MALRLITPATALAVSLIEAKAQLRVDFATEDDLITSMILAATEAAEQEIGRAIMAQTWEVALAAFPAAFELTRTPVQTITSVTYADEAGIVQTLSPSAYALDMADEFGFGWVVSAYGMDWPATRAEANAVKLRYTAGYAVVPESIKRWILLQVGAMYENRESEGARQTHKLGFCDALLSRFKVYS